MLRPIFFVLALTALLPFDTYAKEITIQPGDTLSEIANRYEVSITTLKQINKIHNPNQLQAGAKLILPSNGLHFSTDSSDRIHTVKHGETLSEIANRYSISQREIININNIKSANHLYLGQKLILPNREFKSQSINNNQYKAKNDKAFSALKNESTIGEETKPKKRASFHTVSRGENLSLIAKNYNLPLQDLILNNTLKDPNNIPIGTKISLLKNSKKNVILNEKINFNKPISSSRRIYGPLNIDWANWQVMNGSHVAPTRHKAGQSLFLAVNCSFRRINITGENGDWQEWSSPAEDFEHDLINDRCT